MLTGWLFAFRSLRARPRPIGDAADLVKILPRRQHVLVTGGTGFIGRRLVEALTSAGHDVTVLMRDPAKAATLRPPFRLVTRLGQIASDTVIDAVINLAGEPITDGLWTRAKRRRILASRLRVTREVVSLMQRLERRPAVLISGSAVAWYGLWKDESLTEFDGHKRGFIPRVCEAWEGAARRAEGLGVRVVRLRIGAVLGLDGGILERMLVPFGLGLGGPLGTGEQWISWIERDDLIRLIAHIVATPGLTGAVNGTAPMPAKNAVLARELGRVLHLPALVRIPASLLRGLLGDIGRELALGGQRVLPDKADGSGFKFRHETLAGALAAICGGQPVKKSAMGSEAAPRMRARDARAAPSPLGKAVPAVARAMAGLLARPPKL